MRSSGCSALPQTRNRQPRCRSRPPAARGRLLPAPLRLRPQLPRASARLRHRRRLHAACNWDGERRNSGFSVDATVRIALIDRDVPSYFRSLEHLLRYCARPPFALERLSVTRDARGHASKVRYVLPRHKAANWVGPGQHASGGHGTGGCCDSSHEHQKPRSHDTSRIAWAKLMARVGEEFPFACPNCGGDIRLIAFRLLSDCETIPGLRTLGNPRLLRTSCPRAGADPEDPHAFG